MRTDPKRGRRGAEGLSLVELLVVLAIMSVLASIGMPLAELAQRRAKEEELRLALREIRAGLDAYKLMTDTGRIERKAGASGYPPALSMLVDGVADAKSANGARLYILRRLPRDPFAPDSVVDASRTWGLRSYASPPDQPAAGNDVFDVHSLSTGVGLNGIPYRNW